MGGPTPCLLPLRTRGNLVPSPGVSLTPGGPLHISVAGYKLPNVVPGALPAGTRGGRGQGQAAALCCLVKEDRSWGKSLIKDGGIRSGSGKAHQGSDASSAESSPWPALMPLCKRCGVSITARDG